MPIAEKPIPDEFTVRVSADGKPEYCCKSCTKVHNGHMKWCSTKTFIRKHCSSAEHQSSLARLRELELEKKTLAFEAAQEAARFTEINSPTPREPPAPISRPQVPFYSIEDVGSMEYLEDITFSAGPESMDHVPTVPLSNRPQFWPEYSGIVNDSRWDSFSHETTVAAVISELNRAKSGQTRVLDLDQDDIICAPAKSDYYPYRNKTEFLLDLLDSMPRLQLSDAHLSMVIFILKECGVPNVPSLKTFRRVQAGLRKSVPVPTYKRVSERGNIFYVNGIGAQIAQDFANPLVRPFIHVYPEIGCRRISEVWQAQKWAQELDATQLTPMAIGYKKQHFYVQELASTFDGRLLIPVKWVTKDSHLWAYCWTVTELQDSSFAVQRATTTLVRLSELKYSFPVLCKKSTQSFRFRDEDKDLRSCMPNPWRVKSEGRPVFCVQLRIWQDDVSGNVSKQWNKHWMFCMTQAGIPKKLLAQEYFTHYICCSPEATVLEQARAIIDAIKESIKDGIVAFDSELDEEVMLFLNLLFESGDNPMICEICSHIGLRGNKFCPRCNAGGDKKYKVSDLGYESLFQISTLRERESTRQEILSQFRRGLAGLEFGKSQTLTGIKDSAMSYWLQGEAQLQALQKILGQKWTDSDLEKFINPFFTLQAFNPHRDSPVEPLHTVLLGIIKYAWALTIDAIANSRSLPQLQARLQSLNTDGTHIESIQASYLIQYKGGLIGRQFKTISQVLVFTLYGLVADNIRDLWVAAGNMVALMWYPEIEHLEEYLVELKSAIDVFLDHLAIVDANKIVSKAKCHILLHIMDDIRRFGPALILSTETFESFNAVFRRCSVLSNHQAPSRDIAFNMADISRFKHVASGGKWKEGCDWVGPGKAVSKFFSRHDEIQQLLGWTDTPKKLKGLTVRKPGKRKQQVVFWRDTLAAKAVPLFAHAPTSQDSQKCIRCISCTTDDLDNIREGSFAVFDSEDQNITVGRVHEILEVQVSATECAEIYLVAQKLSVGGQHARLKMPTIHSGIEPSFFLARIKNIRLPFNAQHDCERSGCQETGSIPQIQEREKTTRLFSTVEHVDSDHFIVNMHSLHSPHILRQIFGRNSLPLAPDRISLHKTLAAKVRAKARTDSQSEQQNTEKRKASSSSASQHPPNASMELGWTILTPSEYANG